MKILITGSNGLLGQKLVAQLLKKKVEFLATSIGPNRNVDCPAEKYATMDITNPTELSHVILQYLPSHIIHTAAMTNVDACELASDRCDEINVKSVQSLAEICNEHNIHLQLLSTDFIFDGLKGNYNEEDIPNPQSVYARSKWKAEKILSNYQTLNFSIVRTIIVYGKGNQLSRSNVVLWAIDALKKAQAISVIDDQFRAPTWADDLAWACIRICELNQKGIFHISGPETMSIYELVKRIADFYQFSMENVKRIQTASLKQSAHRPPKTGFNLKKSMDILAYSPMTLEETLKQLS